MVFFLQFIHLLSLTLWVGSMVFFSFIAAPAIFKALPRETAGDVVAKIFPKYYQLGCICSVLTLGTLALLPSAGGAWHMAQMTCLGLMTLVTFYSGFVIGPKVRRFKAEVRASKEEPDHEKKSKQFSRLHGISMALNMLVLLLGLTYIALTSLDFKM